LSAGLDCFNTINPAPVMTSSVTVVVTQREGFHFTRESLYSLLDSLGRAFPVIYVDGASPPECRDFLAARSPGQLLHIREERFLSPNEAKNLAIPHIRTEFAAFVDNDVLFQSGWLDLLLETAIDKNAASVAPFYRERIGISEKIHMAGGEARIVEIRDRRLLVVTHDERKSRGEVARLAPFATSHIEMHALLVRTDFLRRRPELFDSAIPSIPENVDFCLGLLDMGGAIWMDPRAVVTVILPTKIPAADRPFYLFRWSQESQLRGLSHFRKKWKLAGIQPVLNSQLRWSVAHRVVGRSFSLHRLLGVPSDSILNRRILAPLEHRLLGS
jgi:glycosyltransferase involved in cell wall biosynthesis